MNKKEYQELQKRAVAYFEKASIAVTEVEKQNIEIADFGLGNILKTGLESIVYINTERCCAKELVLFPGQTCPEHLHPVIGVGNPGKEETFRCRMGTVYLYVEGTPKKNIKAVLPEGSESYYTVFPEIVLGPGEQYTLYPNTKHWFQAGKEGAIVSEFSTHCMDELDIFTDPRVRRLPEIEK